MKLTNTFSEVGSTSSGTKRGSIFYHGPTDGTPLSPVEVSPITMSNSTSSDTEKSDFITELEKDIVQSIDDTTTVRKPVTPDTNANSSRDTTANNSDDPESETNSLNEFQQQSQVNLGQSVPRSILQSVDGAVKPKKVSQPQNLPSKKVDFSEETVVRSLANNVEGARLSRPSELPLFDDNGQPIIPPRSKKKDKRDQRLLSVPNIKFTRQESNKLRDLRARSEKEQGSSFAGNLMRRFSKYQLRGVLKLCLSVLLIFGQNKIFY